MIWVNRITKRVLVPHFTPLKHCANDDHITSLSLSMCVTVCVCGGGFRLMKHLEYMLHHSVLYVFNVVAYSRTRVPHYGWMNFDNAKFDQCVKVIKQKTATTNLFNSRRHNHFNDWILYMFLSFLLITERNQNRWPSFEIWSPKHNTECELDQLYTKAAHCI